MITLSKRCACYCRVSTEEQTRGYSLATQLDAERRLAAELGYSIVAEISEDHTGTTLDRPGINQLRQLIAAGLVDVVIAYEIDRLARPLLEQLLIEDELRHAHVELRYVLATYAANPEGQLARNVRGIISEYERVKILERLTRGKRGRAKAGHYLPGGRTMYGYRYVAEPHTGRLEIVPEEAEVVRQIYRWYTLGDGRNGRLSARAITRRLTELGIPTRLDSLGAQTAHGMGRWAHSSVLKILSHETYAGTAHWSRTHHGRLAPDDQWIEIPVPAIIDRETWETARQLSTQNKPMARRNVKYTYLMRGRLRCDRCHTSLSGVARKPWLLYYRCAGIDRDVIPTGPRRCSGTLRADLVDERCWSAIAATLQDPAGLIANIRRQHRPTQEQTDLVKTELAAADRALLEIDRREALLLDAYLRSGLSQPLYQSSQAALLQQRAAAKAKRSDLERQAQAAAVADSDLSAIETACQELAVGIATATEELKLSTLDALSVRGTVLRGATRREDSILLVGILHGIGFEVHVTL